MYLLCKKKISKKSSNTIVASHISINYFLVYKNYYNYKDYLYDLKVRHQDMQRLKLVKVSYLINLIFGNLGY